MAELPTDLTAEILIHLPVKSLLRFRCVSKSFLALIDSPDFSKRHLNRSLHNKTNHKLILGGRSSKVTGPNGNLYLVDLYQLDRTVQLDQPCGKGYQIIGSVNGLLCLYGGIDDIVIWNFATRDYHKLPATKIDFSYLRAYAISYGFGYDSVSDDYKLVMVVQFNIKNSDSLKFEAKVYSLRSNSWQRTQDFPYLFHGEKRYGQLVCGALHWVVVHKHGSDLTYSIVAFDLSTNEYRLVDHLEFLNKGRFNLIKLEGRLCVLSYSSNRVDVWVMKDYGVKESWGKLFSVSQSEAISSFRYLVPLAYSKSGTEIMLFQDYTKLLWYSLKEGTVTTIHLCGYFLLPEVCVESLVSISGKTENSPQKKKESGGEIQIKVAKKRDHSLNSGVQVEAQGKRAHE